MSPGRIHGPWNKRVETEVAQHGIISRDPMWGTLYLLSPQLQTLQGHRTWSPKEPYCCQRPQEVYISCQGTLDFVPRQRQAGVIMARMRGHDQQEVTGHFVRWGRTKHVWCLGDPWVSLGIPLAHWNHEWPS